MESPSLAEYGVVVALLFIVLKLVFDFLSKVLAKRNGQQPETAQAPESSDAATLQGIKDSLAMLRTDISTTKENTFKVLKLVEKIHEMHDIKDEDGVYMWYVKPSLGRAVHKLGDAAEELVKLLKEDHG